MREPTKTTKRAVAKKPASRKQSATKKPAPKSNNSRLRRFVSRIQLRREALLRRRPHRSFKVTHREDYLRGLALPGYWRFTGEVNRTLGLHKRLFLLLGLIFAIASLLLSGMISQDTYSEIKNVINESPNEITGLPDVIAPAYKTALVLFATASGNGGSDMTEVQRMFAILCAILVWLVTVWLLRLIVAGKKPRLRDGLYNAGGPLIATIAVLLIMAAQAIPVGITLVMFGALLEAGIIVEGFPLMLASITLATVVTLSLYWLTSTMFALVVVTLPGMYPWQAIRTASDLVIGRRLRILYRLLWMLAVVGVMWIVTLAPVMALDNWLKSFWSAFASVPLVPATALLISGLIVIWCATYIYLLYRKVVEDNARPA